MANFKYFQQKWKQYRYRFVPWIALNMRKRSVRKVGIESTEKLLAGAKVDEKLRHIFSVFYQNHKSDYKCDNLGETSDGLPPYRQHLTQPSSAAARNLQLLYKTAGFAIEKRPSILTGGGFGIVVTHGRVPGGTVVALYPGTIYRPYEPILLQSLGNPFIFRCLDGLLVDGNDKGLSKLLFRSCAGRDRVGPYDTCDKSWLTSHPVNPLAVGQYINNQTTSCAANVAYQEFDVPNDFPLHLRCYLPNVFYGASLNEQDYQRHVRTVVLIALRDIDEGEELFSNYFTLLH